MTCGCASTGCASGGLIESEAFWININRETQGPARISDDFIAGLQKHHRRSTGLRWKAYLKAGSREDADHVQLVSQSALVTSTSSIT